MLPGMTCSPVEANYIGSFFDGEQRLPENFLTPKRLPGEPPWLWTVPPARFVAVRIAPNLAIVLKKAKLQGYA